MTLQNSNALISFFHHDQLYLNIPWKILPRFFFHESLKSYIFFVLLLSVLETDSFALIHFFFFFFFFEESHLSRQLHIHYLSAFPRNPNTRSCKQLTTV